MARKSKEGQRMLEKKLEFTSLEGDKYGAMQPLVNLAGRKSKDAQAGTGARAEAEKPAHIHAGGHGHLCEDPHRKRFWVYSPGRLSETASSWRGTSRLSFSPSRRCLTSSRALPETARLMEKWYEAGYDDVFVGKFRPAISSDFPRRVIPSNDISRPGWKDRPPGVICPPT